MQDAAREAIAARRDFTLGEVAVAFRDGRVELSGPRSGADAHELTSTAEALREHVRFDEHGRYRPLSGARTLPGNWRVSLSETLAEAAIDAIYPQALLHQQQASQGTLRVTTLDEVVARQRGRYRIAGELDAEGQERARDALCGRCVRAPVWAGEAEPEEEIPCPEPCSVMIALCREAALWQREPPQPSSPDPEVAFADFQTEGNEVREAYLARTPAGATRG
ncbi:MAG: DR2241 family protein [Chloroflexota bacterium]|nr:DR2241 family protein [Chloroflexota bacterium]